MDPMFAKLIASREKTLAVLDSEIARFEETMKSSASSSVSVAFANLVNVKKLRRAKVAEELKGFREAAAAQLTIPGSEAAPPKGGRR